MKDIFMYQMYLEYDMMTLIRLFIDAIYDVIQNMAKNETKMISFDWTT